jgi:septation ring formation regulator EzrA
LREETQRLEADIERNREDFLKSLSNYENDRRSLQKNTEKLGKDISMVAKAVVDAKSNKKCVGSA